MIKVNAKIASENTIKIAITIADKITIRIKMTIAIKIMLKNTISLSLALSLGVALAGTAPHCSTLDYAALQSGPLSAPSMFQWAAKEKAI